VHTDGGPSITLADSVATGYGIAWLDDGTLVFTNQTLLGMRRISAAGGPVSVALADGVIHGDVPLLPTPLPGSRGVLFVDGASNGVRSSLHVLDLKTGKQKAIVDGVVMGWYLPNGELLYVRRDGVALVVRFDLSDLSTRGVPVPVLQGVSAANNQISLTLSRSGTLIYAAANAGSDVVTLRYTNPIGLLGWMYNAHITGTTEHTSGQVRLFEQLVAPWALPLDRLVAPPLGLSLFAVGRARVPVA